VSAPSSTQTDRLDLDFARAQFPAFSEPSLAGFAYFENAGGSYTCGQAIERLDGYYRRTRLQPGYPSAPSRQAAAQLESARARLAAWLDVGADELHFGPSTSQNTYVIAQALRGLLRPGDEVVVTNQDHEANIGAWRRLEDAGVVVREWRIDPQTAELRTADLEALLGPRTRAVAFTHCSNVVGSINPVAELTRLVHRAGAWAMVDGVAFCPHGLPDVGALGADLYVFSLYKVYGPHLGAMYLSRELNEALPAQGHFFNAGKAGSRFTPAGPDHAQIAAVNGVMDYLDAVADRHGHRGHDAATRSAAVRQLFRERETALLQPLLDYLAGRDDVRLIGSGRAAGRAPTVAFTVEGRRPAELAAALGARGLGVGAGHFYAYRLVEALGIDTGDGVLRASFLHYTAEEELRRLVEALDALA
jgi:cysteine desulfurase family protein (TIGR01976 family)